MHVRKKIARSGKNRMLTLKIACQHDTNNNMRCFPNMRFFSKNASSKKNRKFEKKSHVYINFLHVNVNMRCFPNIHVGKKSHVNMQHLFRMDACSIRGIR